MSTLRYNVYIPIVSNVDEEIHCSKAELGTAPVSALGVVLDGIIGTEPNPLRQGAVLPLLLGKGALGAEGLLGRHLGANNSTG
mmetsp:Transcript_30128/g.66732  ORF Transcript_30128/g.66732 Transcript_30128/m.66732 type:complete len:83 (+) Transcript_30128:209-457(+)